MEGCTACSSCERCKKPATRSVDYRLPFKPVKKNHCVVCGEYKVVNEDQTCISCQKFFPNMGMACDECASDISNICRVCKKNFAPYGDTCVECAMKEEWESGVIYDGPDRCIKCLKIDTLDTTATCFECYKKVHGRECNECGDTILKEDKYCFRCSESLKKCSKFGCKEMFVPANNKNKFCEEHSPKCIVCRTPIKNDKDTVCNDCLLKHDIGNCVQCGSLGVLVDNRCNNCEHKRQDTG